MKVVILAGGRGSRLAEETQDKPKPMVEIGGMPIIWHIMKSYAHHGLTDFVICLGYKGYLIKEFFFNYYKHMSDMTVDLSTNDIEVHNVRSEPWKVTLVDTGIDTMTGGRLKRVASYLGDDDFCLTYGDGVSDVDIKKLIAFHQQHQKHATLTAVNPMARFGALDIESDNHIKAFREKSGGDEGMINGGFFVCSPKVLDYVDGDQIFWEREPLEKLAQEEHLMAYKHEGFWQCMDTLRDRQLLERLWDSGQAAWKQWD